MRLLIGTSGFSYEDWKGHFYPRSLSRSRMLEYYAERFPTVEVNSTYYALPRPEVMESLVRRTPDGFLFSVKAHQSLTHGDLPAERDWSAFRACLAPLAEVERLGAVLAQFPHAFRPGPAARDRLRTLSERLAEFPVVVEFRNALWAGTSAAETLGPLGLGYCCVDEPRLRGLMPAETQTTSGVGYLRFHGRNAARWWKHDAPWQRYDYLYNDDELQEWVPRVREIANQAPLTLVYFNNHYEGKAAHNARRMMELLELPVPAPSDPPGEAQGRLALEE